MLTPSFPIQGRMFFARFVGSIFDFCARVLENTVSTVRRRKLMFSAVVVCFLVTSLVSVAQTPPAAPPKPPSLGFDALDVLGMIADGIDAKLNSLSNSTALLAARDIILGVGLAIGLFWTGLKTMVAGKGIGELLGEWIPILITAGVVTAFTTPGPNSAGVQIANTLDRVAGAITQAAGGTAIDTSSVRKVTEAAATTTFKTIVAIKEVPKKTSGSITSLDGILQYVMWIPATIAELAMKIMATLAVVIAMCVYMATAIMAMMSIKLVIALAPVMVPFLIFKPTAWMFDSWLKFLLGAGMLKLVGAFMLSITSGLMSSMNSVAQAIKADAAAGAVDSYSGDIVLFSTLLLVTVLCSLLMAQVPSIAQGLIAGAAGGAGFSGLKGVSQTLGQRVGPAAVGGAAAFALDRAVGGRIAAKRGHADAVDGFSNGGKHFGSRRSQNAYLRSNAQSREVQSALRRMSQRNDSESSKK